MTCHNEDVNRILKYLTRNDQDIDRLNQKPVKMDTFQQEGLLSDTWPAEDDFLENIFSLEQGSLDFLDAPMPDFNNLCQEDVPPPPETISSSCSDSGVSSDQAEFDFEQQLSPFLIQNSCDDDANTAGLEPTSPGNVQDVIIQENDASNSSSTSNEAVEVDAFDMLDFEQNVVPGFINNNHTFHNTGKGNRKRRLSQTPQVVVQPKVQKSTIKIPANTTQKPQLVVKAQPQRPVKVSNIQLLNPQTKVYSKPVETVAPQRRVIRVAPMAGNPRSILLPVTIKDMKDLKSIKIINAADLKNAGNIKLAAANLLAQGKLDLKEARNEYEYDQLGNHCDDSGSERSDDEDDKEPVPDGRNGYPRLVLTAEERRLLAKEGITLPTSYPLTKHEERELKRIRRKIRNKISAQDSRKRKKEYVDGLEDRVKQCSVENQTLMRRIKILQSQNQSLSAQLRRLQNVLTGVTSGPPGKSAQPATCLLVLLLSVALVALPSMREEGLRRQGAPAERRDPAPAVTRALLSANKMVLDETVIDDGEFNMDELITFNRPHSDHDYQIVKSLEPRKPLPGGYVDIPIDEDWPPNLKKRMKKLEFDYGDGKDFIAPIVKDESYENYNKIDVKFKTDSDKDNYLTDKEFLTNTLISTSRKLGELLDLFPPVPVKNEDLVIEEISDYDTRNVTDIKSFVVNSTLNDY